MWFGKNDDPDSEPELPEPKRKISNPEKLILLDENFMPYKPHLEIDGEIVKKRI